jgi:hypothetical protein
MSQGSMEHYLQYKAKTIEVDENLYLVLSRPLTKYNLTLKG